MPFSFFKGNNKNQKSIETPKDDGNRVEEIAVSLIPIAISLARFFPGKASENLPKRFRITAFCSRLF